MSAMEDNVKLIIRLKFKAENTKDWTYFECLQRKDKLRAGLYLYIQNIIQIFKPKFPIQNKVNHLYITILLLDPYRLVPSLAL